MNKLLAAVFLFFGSIAVGLGFVLAHDGGGLYMLIEWFWAVVLYWLAVEKIVGAGR